MPERARQAMTDPGTAVAAADRARVREEFSRRGYVVVPGLCDRALREEMRDIASAALRPLEGPAEFEADVGYDGSPRSRTEQRCVAPALSGLRPVMAADRVSTTAPAPRSARRSSRRL